jgi:hypothetical protein
LIPGCTDPEAPNYDPRATVDHGFCGDWTFFYKRSGADSSYAENQDCLDSDVCITRGDNQPLYNAAVESSWDLVAEDSPKGTQWAVGFTSDTTAADYENFIEMAERAPYALPERRVSVHAVGADTWYDIAFTKWESNAIGGGVAYFRREAPPPSD